MLRGLPQAGGRLGKPDADATLTIYAKVDSAAFSSFDRRVVPHLIKLYVEPGRLALQLRTLPSGGSPPDVADLAQAAGLQSRLWQFVRTANGDTAADPLDAAKDVPGLRVDQLKKDARTRRVHAAVDKAQRLAADADVKHTPAFRLSVGRKSLRIAPSSAPTEFVRSLDAALPSG